MKGEKYSVVLYEVEKGIVREREPEKHVRQGFDPELQIPIFRLVCFVYVVG